MIKIVDASVAIKWFLDEAPGKPAALAVLAEIEKNPKEFAVPELFFCEILSVLCRLSLSEREVVESLSLLENLGFSRIGHGSEVLAHAARFALRFKLTGYDALYVACAHLTSGKWITFDAKAHSKIASLSRSECLA